LSSRVVRLRDGVLVADAFGRVSCLVLGISSQPSALRPIAAGPWPSQRSPPPQPSHQAFGWRRRRERATGGVLLPFRNERGLGENESTVLNRRAVSNDFGNQEQPGGDHARSAVSGDGIGLCIPRVRPSGPPPATQRRTISVVEQRMIGESATTLLARAAASWRAGTDASDRLRRGVPGMTMCGGGGSLCRKARGAHCQTPHVPVGVGLPACSVAAPATATGTDAAAASQADSNSRPAGDVKR